MKKNIDLVVLGIMYMLLGFFIVIKTDARSHFMLLYTSCLFIGMKYYSLEICIICFLFFDKDEQNASCC